MTALKEAGTPPPGKRPAGCLTRCFCRPDIRTRRVAGTAKHVPCHRHAYQTNTSRLKQTVLPEQRGKVRLGPRANVADHL